MWLKKHGERIFLACKRERDGKESFDVLSILYDEDFLELFGVQAPAELTEEWQEYEVRFSLVG